MGRDDQGVLNSLQRWQTIPRVLCFVVNQLPPTQVLLLRGAPTKRIWPNRINGVGGHVERHEDIKAGALREIREETGLAAETLHLCGVVQIDNGAPVGIMMFVWIAISRGTPHQTVDGTLNWYAVDQLPTVDLVDDLTLLLPRVLAYQPQNPPWWAHYSYDEHDRLCIAWHG